MPKEGVEIDWKNDSTFNFEYEIGISPEFEVKLCSNVQYENKPPLPAISN